MREYVVFFFKSPGIAIQASKEIEGRYPFAREKVPSAITGRFSHCEIGIITLYEFRTGIESTLGTSQNKYDFSVYESDMSNSDLKPFLDRWEKLDWNQKKKACHITV